MSGQTTYWLDDMTEGRSFELGRFVCDAALIDGYADLLDARHPVHVDAEFAAKTPFGRRIAQGPLPLAKAMSMLGQEIGASIEAMSGMTDWRLVAPVFVDDVVAVALVVRRIDRRPGAANGKVTAELRLTVGDRPVQTGELRMLVRAARAETIRTNGDRI